MVKKRGKIAIMIMHLPSTVLFVMVSEYRVVKSKAIFESWFLTVTKGKGFLLKVFFFFLFFDNEV